MGEVMIFLDQLPQCCTDLDISFTDLLFPENMSPEGKEFVRAHELPAATLRQLQRDATLLPNGLVKIKHRCAQLRDDGKCAIYDTRPVICREFNCALRSDCGCNGNGCFSPNPSA